MQQCVTIRIYIYIFLAQLVTLRLRVTSVCLCVWRCLTLVVDGVGHHWAETVFSAVLPLELTLKTQTHGVHVHVFNAL